MSLAPRPIRGTTSHERAAQVHFSCVILLHRGIQSQTISSPQNRRPSTREEHIGDDRAVIVASR